MAKACLQFYYAGSVFFHSTIAKRFNIEPDMAAVQNVLKNTLPNLFNYLDGAIGDKFYLVDNHFSFADISMVTAF